MTRFRVVALIVMLLGIAAGTGGGLWYRHAAHELPAPNQPPVALATPPKPSPAPSPTTSTASTTSSSRDERRPPATQEARRSPASPPAAVAPPAPKPDGSSPSFDIVRVEPRGDAVVAGKGAPNAKVALLSGGKVVGEATSDANGQFGILPPPLAPGDHALTLRQSADGKPARDSAQSVAVSVPAPGKDKVVVALAEPGRATKLLSPPPGSAAGAPASTTPADKVVVRSAELENGSGVYVSGAAHPGTPVHVYLNDSHLADVVAGADGAWSVRVKHGLTGGHYRVRADAAGTDGKVASRAEVPFDVPMAMAEAAAPPIVSRPATPAPAPAGAAAPPAAVTPKMAAGPAPATPAPTQAETVKSAGTATPEAAAPASEASNGAKVADATVETIATARVTRGDNLWNISRFRLGDGLRYTQIYAANSDQIRDPNLIYPGQVFVVPNR